MPILFKIQLSILLLIFLLAAPGPIDAASTSGTSILDSACQESTIIQAAYDPLTEKMLVEFDPGDTAGESGDPLKFEKMEITKIEEKAPSSSGFDPLKCLPVALGTPIGGARIFECIFPKTQFEQTFEDKKLDTSSKMDQIIDKVGFEFYPTVKIESQQRICPPKSNPREAQIQVKPFARAQVPPGQQVRKIPPDDVKSSASGVGCNTETGATPNLNANPPETNEEFFARTNTAQEHRGVFTAIGCIPSNPTVLIEKLLRVAIGAGGGIALLLMIAGVFQMMTSAGNPDGLKKGQEQLTAAAIGLLFIIFSVMLLQILGVDILGLDTIAGFTK